MRYIKHPIATEKAVRLIESDNVLTFIVDRKATKADIKREIEEEFKVKVEKVRVMVDTKGRKKAMVKLSRDTPAVDVASRLGII